MSKTLDELREAITTLDTKVDEDLAQTAALIVSVNALLARIESGADFQTEVDALTATVAKLTSDNPAVQAAIDAASSQTPPTP